MKKKENKKTPFSICLFFFGHGWSTTGAPPPQIVQGSGSWPKWGEPPLLFIYLFFQFFFCF
jgi:hypothetical protein